MHHLNNDDYTKKQPPANRWLSGESLQSVVAHMPTVGDNPPAQLLASQACLCGVFAHSCFFFVAVFASIDCDVISSHRPLYFCPFSLFFFALFFSFFFVTPCSICGLRAVNRLRGHGGLSRQGHRVLGHAFGSRRRSGVDECDRGRYWRPGRV